MSAGVLLYKKQVHFVWPVRCMENIAQSGVELWRAVRRPFSEHFSTYVPGYQRAFWYTFKPPDLLRNANLPVTGESGLHDLRKSLAGHHRMFAPDNRGYNVVGPYTG